jgi:hypothetical protein
MHGEVSRVLHTVLNRSLEVAISDGRLLDGGVCRTYSDPHNCAQRGKVLVAGTGHVLDMQMQSEKTCLD